jgi:hypothetical protein
MANAPIDSNSRQGLIAASSDDGITPVTLYANPDTHRLLVDLPNAQAGADITVAADGADFTDIQSALDAVGNGGGTIYVADGTYTITTGLLVKKSSTVLNLSGGAVVQCNGANVATLIKPNTTGLSRIKIIGGKWLQTNATLQGTAFDFSDSADCEIAPTRIEAFGTAILLNDTTNGTFYNHYHDIQIFDCNNGIVIGVDAASTQPNDNYFDAIRVRPKAGGAGYGLRVADARGLTFVGCDFEPATATGITGISLEVNGTSSGVAREITFVNCWVENNATNLSIASGCNRILFLGCTITAPGSTNITDNGTNTVFINTNNNAALLNSYGAVVASSYKVGSSAGATGTFTTTDGKTVTVTSGIITSIV